MKRLLIKSPAFVRAARAAIKKQPQVSEPIRFALEQLSENAIHPKLKTHKLKGKLSGSWACSAGYDLRIVFRFGKYEDHEAIFLETIGTHEEVY
jgi:mRNA-degrading endonuclease YafQ of YafQ-DinJ toxin-antitoxin module